MRSRGVTFYLEPKFLYNFKGASASTPDENYIIPFGKAKVRREGKDVSIISYGSAIHLSLQAAEELEKEGISVEVVDLRSLVPWDKDTVFQSVRKTSRVIVAHEDKLTGGFGGEIVSEITENCFKYLDAPILRVGSKGTPVGFAKNYEVEILLTKNDIMEKVKEVSKF